MFRKLQGLLYGAALHLEQLWNDLAQTQSFSLRCAYPIAGFSRESDGEPFLKICAAHSEVIPDESYTSLPSSEERLRSIGLLQQRAQALETEKADRQKAQAALRGKESELADVLENALEGAQQTGPNKKILWANRALLKLLGYDATEYIDHPFVDFFVERHIFEEYWQRLMRGEDVYDYPVDLRCRNGSIKHVRFHANGLWQEGKFALSRCFIRDVTEQAEAENALRESEANLRVAKDELDPLLSNVPPRCASCRREFLYCRMKNAAVLPASCTIVWANTWWA